MSRLSKQLTADEILQSTNGGRNIFEKEIGEIPKKCINSPLREDNNPSFSIFLANNGLWMYKDFSNGDSGTAIQFIQKLYDLDYNKAISYILGLNIHTNTTQNKVIKAEKKEIIIDFVDKPFSREDKKYWGKYGLPEDFLRDNNVYSVKTYAINKKIIKHNDERLIFAYMAPETQKCKLLFIGKNVEKSEKWKSNIESNYLWYLPKTPCSQLWVVKSVKDALCLKYHFNKCVTAVQSENSSVLDKNMPRILEISKDIVINFGADPQGVESCKPVQQKWQTKYFNTDKTMLKYGVVDPSDVIATFGVKVLEKQLKKKGFL